jgi:hypothetical protein
MIGWLPSAGMGFYDDLLCILVLRGNLFHGSLPHVYLMTYRSFWLFAERCSESLRSVEASMVVQFLFEKEAERSE